MVLLRHRSTCDRHVAVCERHSSGSTYYLMHLEKLTLCFLIRYTFSSLEKEGCVFIRGEITISWESHGDVFSSEEASCCLGPADLYTTTQTHCQEQMTSNVVKVVGHSEDPTSSRFSCVIPTTTGFVFYFATVSVLCA